MAARAAVEALLRERKLDRTLTSTLPERLGEDAVAPLDTDALDRGLAGGLPRGQVSEVVGPASSGRTSVAWAALAAASRRGESIALIDTFDRFDPPTAQASGIDLSKLLWVRGQAISKTSGAIDPAWLPGLSLKLFSEKRNSIARSPLPCPNVWAKTPLPHSMPPRWITSSRAGTARKTTLPVAACLVARSRKWWDLLRPGARAWHGPRLLPPRAAVNR